MSEYKIEQTHPYGKKNNYLCIHKFHDKSHNRENSYRDIDYSISIWWNILSSYSEATDILNIL